MHKFTARYRGAPAFELTLKQSVPFLAEGQKANRDLGPALYPGNTFGK
jgi:hypothetical protein